mmetsp:Transcript_8953/g.24820  ORF Transcript_8953/g.24820 Transcript_8953/m.24820 type:complete len:740 (-) Transcript_8953:189-2408(-)
MKFGEHLKANIAPEYGEQAYLDYQQLDSIISELSQTKPSAANESRVVSLTAPPQTNAQGLDTSKVNVTEETFLAKIDSDMVKVEKFTLSQVTKIRAKIMDLEALLKQQPSSLLSDEGSSTVPEGTSGWNEREVVDRADEIGNDFLRLEKYVNINFMGFHKILKKHDKNLPNNPCKVFYINRLNAQAWVRGDYSDIVVRLSNIYASVRQDHVAEENKDAAQSFARSTTKYWVKTEDVSKVKYAVLRHLPVFLQKTSTGESDSQFTNSVYLDNDQLELYHGRLDKTPGAIALRLRWYGSGDPQLVFVERKTHNDKWTGEVSVKERFTVHESEVPLLLQGRFPIQEKKAEMIAKGKSPQEIDEWETLVREICQVIVSKQLVPTMRTQCMRTAFQIPFDATVRVSLDTNLCMISERGYDLQDMHVWHRDKSWVLEKNEITRFPHGVLEIKLEMGGGNLTPPKWVTDLQNSGMLYECHKYSKYVHGCAALMPDEVRAVPYWIDDISLRQSILESDGGRVLADPEEGVGPGATAVYQHLLPFGTTVEDRTDTALGRTSADKAASQGLVGEKAPLIGNYGVNFYSGDEEIEEEDEFAADLEDGICGWFFPFCSRLNVNPGHDPILAPTSVQKIEPKVFFANERTYLHWLHHGVILSSISAGILAFSEQSGATWGEWYALALLPISLGFCIYALHIFLWRADRIKTRIPGRWDDPKGPLLLGGAVVLILSINFIIKLVAIAEYDKEL